MKQKLRILLPESLRKTVPPSTPNVTFAPSEPSGGFSKAAEPILMAAASESDITLFVGDLGKNAVTSTTIASVIKNTTRPIILTRDTIDLITPESPTWIDRSNLTLLLTLPQLQKLFRAIYYPRVITLSQPLNQLVETLHKFTITYGFCTVATLHTDQFVVSAGGQVVTTPLSNTKYSPLSLFAAGELAAITAVFQIRQPVYPLEAAATAILAK